MKMHHEPHQSGTEEIPEAGSRHEETRRQHRLWRGIGLGVLTLLIALGVGRVVLPWFVRDYVNRTLDRNPTYAGTIGQVDVHLWRGAYSIQEIRISKRTGNVPVPFFEAQQLDLSVQWSAVLHGRMVGQIVMDRPRLNFVDAASESEDQTGGDAPWLQILRDLFPFKINSLVIRNGSVHFRAFEGEEPMDVYISELQGTVNNLGNIRDETTPLVATVKASGLAMDHAKVEFQMTLDPFSYRPTFHLALRLLNLDVTRVNDLAMRYGNFDFERGWFDLVVEADAKEGILEGYAKPLFRNLKVLSLRDDIKDENVLRMFWQAIVGAVTSIFKNQPRDQFGTVIPFSGDLSGATTADILATVGNILRNAFVRAYLPRLESGGESIGGITFGPPELTDPVSVSDTF